MWARVEGFAQRSVKQREAVEGVLVEGAGRQVIDAKNFVIHVSYLV